MAATVKKNIWLRSTTDGQPVATRNVQMAASQGIYIPDTLAYLSQSGTVKISDTADGTGDVTNLQLTDKITAAHSVNDIVTAAVVERRNQYCIYVENNDSDSAAAQAIVGNQYGYRIATGSGKIGYATLDINNSNTVADVIDIMSNLDDVKFTVSTDPGVALIQFMEDAIQAAKA